MHQHTIQNIRALVSRGVFVHLQIKLASAASEPQFYAKPCLFVSYTCHMDSLDRQFILCIFRTGLREDVDYNDML